jgi:hypothetical protein
MSAGFKKGWFPTHANLQVLKKPKNGYFSAAYNHDSSFFERIWIFLKDKIAELDEPFFLMMAS